MDEKNGGTAFRLKSERDRLGLSQPEFADKANTKLRTLQNWEGGKNYPSSEFLAEAAKFGVDIAYVLTGQRTLDAGMASAITLADKSPAPYRRALSGMAPAPSSDADTVYVPLLTATGSMGPGNELLTEDVVMGEVPLSRQWLSLFISRSRHSSLRLVHAYGDSMMGTLNSGDFAIVDTACKTADVDGVYVLQAHGQLFIKRITRGLDGSFTVSSDNPQVRTVSVLDGSHPIEVLGRVVYGWNGRRF